jgi:Xaa-Pro aminopeptidase
VNETEFAGRRRSVAEELLEKKIDGLLVTARINVRYLSGFTGSSAALLITQDGATLLTDPRYEIQAAHETSCRVRVAKGPLIELTARILSRRGLKRVGFERNRISYAEYAMLTDKLPGSVRLVPVNGLVEARRMIKSHAEAEALRCAASANSQAFDRATAKLRAGMAESDLAAEIDYEMRRAGAEGPAFETIVASGGRSALPHARPTANPILNDRLLLVDMGANRNGYASDMTRMLFPGKPGTKTKRLYKAVLDAQLAAIAAVRDGARSDRVDAAARRVLRSAGLDRRFVHSTGHGLGLEIHEPPRLGRREKTVLRAGMAITIEPGVYLEDFGGIRIEDTVLVTPTGCEILTPTSKHLLSI